MKQQKCQCLPLIESLNSLIKDISDYYSGERVVHNNYEHLGEFCSSSIVGFEVKLCDNDLSRTLFESFLGDVSYCQVYKHPTKFDDKGKQVKDDKFIPLLMNKVGGIVSYLWYGENDVVLVLPQTNKKRELLQKVMQELMYKYFSKYFPEIEKSSWLNLPIYFLPNQKEMLKEKEDLIAKFNENLIVLEKNRNE